MLLDAVEYSTKVHIEREMVEVLRTLATRYESVGGPAQRLLKTVRGLQLAYAESDVPMTLMAVALDQNTPPELLRDMLQQGERGAKRAKAKEIEEGKKGGGGKGGGTAGTPAVDALQPKPEAEDSPTTATPSPKYGGECWICNKTGHPMRSCPQKTDKKINEAYIRNGFRGKPATRKGNG
jgi:hypothetical protein